jgi:hypothetical protein
LQSQLSLSIVVEKFPSKLVLVEHLLGQDCWHRDVAPTVEHRNVAISNRRLIACDENGVTFKWKDYRIEGPDRYKVMTLATHEFIRRFLIHVLPAGFHRIRYYGLLASGRRAENVARARELLMPPVIPVDAIKASSPNAAELPTAKHACPCCGGRMIIIERFEPGATPHHRPSPPISAIRIDTS